MQKKREQLHKILDLILDINGLEERKQGSTEKKPTTFLGFYGHTNTIDVNVYKKGWKPRTRGEIDYVAISVKEEILNGVIEELELMKKEINHTMAECKQCGQEGVKQDMLETIEGYTCEECMKEQNTNG